MIILGGRGLDIKCTSADPERFVLIKNYYKKIAIEIITKLYCEYQYENRSKKNV